MSYTNGTTHYNLPLTTGNDKRDWADANQAFADVDAALYGAVQDTAQAELDIAALEERMDTAEQNISTNTGNISGLDTRLTTAEGAITSQAGQIMDTRQDLEDMICAYNEASATSTHAYAIGDYFIYNDVLYRAIQAIAIGDTIVPDTNCSTTNVTTEIKGVVFRQITSDGVKTWGDILSDLFSTITEDDVKNWIATNKILYIKQDNETSRALLQCLALGYGVNGFYGTFSQQSSFTAGISETWNCGRSNAGTTFFDSLIHNYQDINNITQSATIYTTSVLPAGTLYQLIIK